MNLDQFFRKNNSQHDFSSQVVASKKKKTKQLYTRETNTYTIFWSFISIASIAGVLETNVIYSFFQCRASYVASVFGSIHGRENRCRWNIFICHRQMIFVSVPDRSIQKQRWYFGSELNLKLSFPDFFFENFHDT